MIAFLNIIPWLCLLAGNSVWIKALIVNTQRQAIEYPAFCYALLIHTNLSDLVSRILSFELLLFTFWLILVFLWDSLNFTGWDSGCTGVAFLEMGDGNAYNFKIKTKYVNDTTFCRARSIIDLIYTFSFNSFNVWL